MLIETVCSNGELRYPSSSLCNAVVKVVWSTMCRSTLVVLHGFEWLRSRIKVWCLMCGTLICTCLSSLSFWLLTN